jgi:succinate-semialdehyde dehydrogenase / glutarate-semialdehyde dehydrogenase
MVALVKEAGVPDGVYTNLFLTNDQAGALIGDPRVKGIALTGSERAGAALASRAGKNLKKSTMELGGSDAFIVLDDADLEHTVAMAVVGRFGNNGQTCIGAKRFIVVESMLQKFLPRFVAAAKGLRLGDPLDESVTLGPLSSDAALQLILRQIQEATSHGAQIALGGKRGKRVASRIETGMVFINYPDVSAPDLPFGGIKRSGYGKELSNFGLEEFVNKKLILVPNAAA